MTFDEPVRLRTEVRQAGRAVVLKLEGEFSSATAPALRCLLNTLYESGERDFIVDLTDVDGDEEVINTVLPPWESFEHPDVRVLRPAS